MSHAPHVTSIDRRDFGRLAFGALGYYDMWKIMKARRGVDFDGIVILDHSPAMVGGNYTQTAYGFAYMKSVAGARQRGSVTTNHVQPAVENFVHRRWSHAGRSLRARAEQH